MEHTLVRGTLTDNVSSAAAPVDRIVLACPRIKSCVPRRAVHHNFVGSGRGVSLFEAVGKRTRSQLRCFRQRLSRLPLVSRVSGGTTFDHCFRCAVSECHSLPVFLDSAWQCPITAEGTHSG